MAYRGSVIRLPVGLLGFSGSRNPTQVRPGSLEDVEGVAIDGGLIQKEGGASRLNSSALGSGSVVVSGFNYSPLASVTRDIVFLSNGSVLKDTGAGTFATTMVSGLNNDRDPPPYFMAAGGESVGSSRRLMMFSASNQVQTANADGNTLAAIGSPAADWTGAGNFPTFGILHDGRVWAGGNASDPHRIYYSTLTGHTDFTGAGSGTMAIFPGRGERLVGGVSFKGLLILFKYPRGIYTVTTTDPSPSGWRVDQLTSAVGSVNQQSIVNIDNDVLYLDAGGNMNLLSATNAFGDTESANIGQNADLAEFMRSTLTFGSIRRCVGVWYSDKQQAHFAFPTETSSDNNLRIVADFSEPSIGVRFLLSRRDIPISMWTRLASNGLYKPVHGDNAGFVWLMDTTNRNKNNAAYKFMFETSNMDLSFVDPGLGPVNKTGDFLEIVFEPQGDWDLTVQVIWDDVPGPPLLYRMGGSGAALGTFTLDTDQLTSSGIKSIRKRIAGSGRRVRIVASNEGLNQNVALSDFILSFRATDERSLRNA